MEHDLPEHLRLAAAHRRRRHVTPPNRPTPIRAGDVRVVHCGHLRRLVYVVRIPHEGGDLTRVVVALVHPYVEYATGADRIVDPATSGLPYPIVVERDLVGIVFPGQLDETTLARLAPDTVAAAPCGPAMTGPLDARWAFKQQELVDLQEIVSACTAQVLDRM